MKRTLLLPAGIVLAVAAVALVNSRGNQLAHHAPPQLLPVVLGSAVLERGSSQLTLPAIAEVQALRDTTVSSRISAYLRELPLYEGERFKAGERLAVLDDSQAKADLLRAEATLAQSRLQRETLAADLAAAESNLKAEQARVARLKTLHEKQNVSLEQLQAGEASLASMRARLSAAAAAVRSFDALLQANEAQAEAARENLRYATITAPFDGVVSQRLAQPGDLVTAGKPLLKIIDASAGTRLLVSAPEPLHPLGLRLGDPELGDRVLPLKAWPEASAQGVRRYEARDTEGAAAPGERLAARLVVFDGPGLRVPNEALLDDDGKSGTVLAMVREESPSGSADAGHGAAAHLPAHTAGGTHPEPAPAAHQPGGHGQHGHHAAVRSAKVEAVRVTFAGRGTEGVVIHNPRLAGRTVLVGSPDLLSRVQAGAPFQLRKAKE